MKKILAILAVLFIIPAAGCRNSQDAEAGASSSAAGSTPSGNPSASAYSTVSTDLTPGRTPGLSPEKTLSPTAPPTGSAGQSAAVSAGTPALTPGKTDKITPKPTNTPIKTPSPSSDAAQRAGYTANNIVGVDRYGRTFESIGGEREQAGRDVFLAVAGSGKPRRRIRPICRSIRREQDYRGIRPGDSIHGRESQG